MQEKDIVSGKISLGFDLNSLSVESLLPEATSDYGHPSIPQETSIPGVSQPSHAMGQEGSSDRLSSSPIDIESEDDVVILSSSRGFPEWNNSRRNQTMTVDQEWETSLRLSVNTVEEQVARSSLSTHDKQVRDLMSRTVTNRCLDLPEEYNAKREQLMESEPGEPEKPTKEPTLSCPVCRNELAEPASTICGHIFCLRCIKASVQEWKKCPACRRKLTKKHFHRIYLPAG